MAKIWPSNIFAGSNIKLSSSNIQKLRRESSKLVPSFHTQLGSHYFYLYFPPFLWTVPIKILDCYKFSSQRELRDHISFSPNKVILKLCYIFIFTVDLWTAWIWTIQVHSYMDFLFQRMQLALPHLWVWFLSCSWISGCKVCRCRGLVMAYLSIHGFWCLQQVTWILAFTDVVILLGVYLLDNEMKKYFTIMLYTIYH